MAEEPFKGGTLSGEGEYQDGERHGPWTFYFTDGTVKVKGAYKAGQLDGEWVWYRKGRRPPAIRSLRGRQAARPLAPVARQREPVGRRGS